MRGSARRSRGDHPGAIGRHERAGHGDFPRRSPGEGWATTERPLGSGPVDAARLDPAGRDLPRERLRGRSDARVPRPAIRAPRAPTTGGPTPGTEHRARAADRGPERSVDARATSPRMPRDGQPWRDRVRADPEGPRADVARLRLSRVGLKQLRTPARPSHTRAD